MRLELLVSPSLTRVIDAAPGVVKMSLAGTIISGDEKGPVLIRALL